ncbi:MAG: metallophosphoesterase [Candidatus Riesia sp.]|nr:metallophosphoesterase [Candidatus Riesia sp.]
MRTFCIGDIHGAAKALEQVLERSGFDPTQDKLIQLGDIADGWSETSECVDILVDIQRKSSEKNAPIYLRGNHDVWVYDWMMYGRSPLIWTQQGGKATLESYIKTGKMHDNESGHKPFWLNQKDWHIDEQNRIFVHAGWYYGDIGMPLEKQLGAPVNAGSIAKECHWDRSLLAGARSAHFVNKGGSKATFKAIQQFKEVYIGHTATKSHEVENYLNLWNMDSGAGWYGRLAIMDIDTKEIWYSDFTKELYPDELGRG